MLAFALAAALVAPFQATDDMSRDVLTTVCLPYVTNGTAPADGTLGFAETRSDEENTYLATADEAFTLRLTTTGSAREGNLNRVCVLQARSGAVNDLRRGVRAALDGAGFTAEAGLPSDRPIWTKGGVTVSLRQNDGRAAIMRVTYSTLDAG